ncbi:hypothetical protein ACFLY2_01725 [Patescibacteria group bacterium]
MLDFILILNLIGSLIRTIGFSMLAECKIVNGKVYHFINGIGAIMILLAAYFNSEIEVFILNFFFMIFAIFGYINKPLNFSFLSRKVLFIFILIIFICFNIYYGFDGILKSLGYIGNIFFLIGYLLFANRSIPKKEFIIYSLIGTSLLLPILILKDNYPVLLMFIINALVAIKNFNRKCK